ncbi:hypothetical protein LAZ67_2003844, partial [Cordylochernes scorpioides]
MWDKLLNVYEQSSGQRLDMLYNQFFNSKKDPTDDISKHISKLESLWNDMQNELTKQENLKLPESMLMCRIINTLPDEYFDFKSVWESVSKEERSVDNLTQRLRLLEIRIQQRDECSTSSSTALMANAYENKQNMKGKVTKNNENFQKTRETRECYFCHRKGHLAKDCRYAKQKKLKDKEKNETKLKLNSKLSESLISERFNEQYEDIWICDSGATNHIRRNASFYTSYKDFPTQQTVKVGNNEKLIAYGSGTITIETCVKGFEMKMDKKGCELFKKTTGEVIVEGKRLPGGLYGMLIISIKPENAAEVNLAKTQNVNMLQLWHERFGQQNKRHVQKWLKEQGIDTVMDNEPCETCIYGKQHRLSFGSREQYASTQPGNLIHVDVSGPMQEVSKGGMRNFVCFKDDFTKYRSVYFLKEKSQVIEKLEQFLLETKTTEHIVKEILTDGGKEFVNKETSKITNKYGINHRITMRYTPQQNGSAKKENRTLIEAARSMIYAKNMSLKLWAEAVNTATYVLNRTGSTQIEGKTPYELWFDKKPAVDHLRIFGTECFVRVPDEKRRKLDAKSEKGILVGYCSNKDGYRIWMPNSNKVVTSRDIDEQNDTQDIEKIKSNVQTSDVYNLRDRSNISKSQRYNDAEINIAEGLEPKTYKEAMDSPNAQFWKEAMNEEMNSLTENDVYECTTLLPGQNPIDCKWVLKTKLNSKGEITRYKARPVAKGFVQKKGIDYEETFSPVARHDTIRTLLAIAANEDLKLVQFDIKTAFLYGDLQDQIYIKQPEGFNNGTDLVWKLKKSLYGLKQSPRCWNQKIVNFMKVRCRKESTTDPCLFFRKTNDQLLIIAIYVDDGIIAGTNEQEIKEFLDELMFSFKITSEPLNYFLGIEIERQQDGSIFINQKAYIKIILEKFNMSQANKVGTPTDNSTVPGEAGILENVPFREVIAPTIYDWEAVKRIFKYLVGTTEYGIMYQKGHKVGVLESFSDAYFAGDPETRRSTSGVVCKLAGGAISWLSQKQRSLSLSTTKVELVAASNTAKEVIWLNRLFSEISPLKEQPNIKVDNASTIKLIKNPEFHKRTKHIEAIELKFLQPLMNCTSASQMWQKLLAIHEQKSEFTIGLLWQQFFDARLTSETISDYIAKIENISAQISQIGGTITEDQKVAKILNTLPSSMRYFVAAWESLDPKAQTLNNLTARPLIEETRNQQSGSSKQDEALLHRQARTKPKDTQRSFQDAKKNTKCHYCHKIGHWSRECRKRLANEKIKSKNLHDSKGSSSDYGLILCDNQVEPNDIWYADSGASCSMTFRREWFKTYTPFTSDHPIYLGDNSTLLAEGMGDIEIQAYVDGGWYNTYIRNVLYSPQLKKNLYSLSTSTRRGFNVIIKHDKLQIFMDNDLKAVGVRHDGLYRMLFKVTSSSQGYITSENKLQLWHERLAHLPVATLREMATKGLMDGLQPQDLEGDFFFCEGCQLGKAHRKSCYPSDGKNYQLGEFIYADICGPMQTQSLSKYLYVCLFKDYFSGYRHIYFIKNKSDVLDIFKEYATLIYTQTGNKIKVLRTDNALEFKSDNFADLCKRFGIIHEFTAPYVHEQIGRIERDNRTIVEAARSMLNSRNLPGFFWAEACNTATYILNRSATKQTPGTTPYELFFGTKPNVANYKIFGCNAYMHIPKENRKKWDNKSIKLMFLGYENTSKNFRLWDWKTRKIRISKDVTFDEKATPHSDRESTKPEEIIFQINSAPDESPVATTNIPVQEMLPVSDISSHPMITRSKVSNSQCNFALADEPSNYIDAITSSDSERCKLAMDEEIDALNKNKTWTLERLADGHKPIGCKWVYKIKTESDGTIQRFKARLVAKGYSQIKNVDYFDTFSPVVRYDSLRILLSHAASERMFLKQFDVKTAFLNGELEELVYLEQPEGYKRDDNSCYRLHKKQKENMPKFSFREAVGSLMFASCVSRPDITYAVSQVSKFLEYPGPAHCTTVKNIFRYLKGTPHMGILFTGQDLLVGYSDSDFARDVDSRKSTTGYAFMMNGGTVSWASQRQPIIALSTTESEYIAACSAAKELIWIRRLQQGISCDITKETELYIDNQAAIKLVENPVFHKRTKHIDVRYHFIRSKHEE